MQLASRPAFPEPLLAAMWQLSENSRLGFRLAGSTLHQGFGAGKYLIGIGDTASVVRYAWLESLKAQQQNVPMSKSTYKTATGAATAALDAVIGQSEKTGWEYAGRLVKLANGKYAYTSPTTEQSSTASDPDGGMKEGTRIPAGTTDAGTYHTHPTSCTYCAHDQFSGADNATAVREHLPSYMESGATRSIYLLDGSKRTSILDPTPPTVIRYGPPQ